MAARHGHIDIVNLLINKGRRGVSVRNGSQHPRQDGLQCKLLGKVKRTQRSVGGAACPAGYLDLRVLRAQNANEESAGAEDSRQQEEERQKRKEEKKVSHYIIINKKKL